VNLRITGDPVADELLTRDPFALLMGMALDQQFPMERAFAGPARIRDRFGTLDPAAVAAAPADEFAKICATPPAVHRFPAAMAARIQKLAAVVTGSYGGNAASLWEGAPNGSELLERLQRLPSFGTQKAQIFTALLAKQLGVRPPGWQEAAGRYAEENSFRSVADVVDKASLDRVREFKKRQKSAAKP
jgi:uncharacterized HhH-GPD family protein